MSRIAAARAYKDIANRLEAMGHEVAGLASTAQEAIDRAASDDIVLMDIHIDGQRDGIEAALEIRSRHRLPMVFLPRTRTAPNSPVHSVTSSSRWGRPRSRPASRLPSPGTVSSACSKNGRRGCGKPLPASPMGSSSAPRRDGCACSIRRLSG
jgi:hypothetical protein